ncbi:eIF1-like protein [Ascobolus immersus RN42]|uniref:Translation machinery-associated protein 22 n=1 Tax=Ascobolus immersus RN42 TaxID=1160509 RepID=A0A3N4I9C8_ASCIM|nr:eIF1-like protein [Ascobolus immersus RN42]
MSIQEARKLQTTSKQHPSTMSEITEPQAKNVLYCAVCSFPPEYCEFGPSSTKCKEWLQKSHPELYSKIWEADPAAAAAAPVNPATQDKAAHAQAKLEAKHMANLAKEMEKAKLAKIQITEIERTKRKHVTVIVGLEDFGLDMKKTAKELGKKFATGCSVTKRPAGGEEITLQGECGEEVKDWLEEVKKIDGKQIDVGRGKK